MKRDNVHAQATRCLCPVATHILTLQVECAIKASKHAAHPIVAGSIVIIVTIVNNINNNIVIICSMPACIEQRLIAWLQLLTARVPCSRCECG
jgi:hypothetical protein